MLTPISAGAFVNGIKEAFGQRPPLRQPLGWVLSVPDTHQRTTLAALEKEPTLRLLTCATEDDANAVAAGLFIGGEQVLVMIQHAGLYASVNTLRGVAIDGRVPVLYLIGLLGREPDRPARESRNSMVRLCEPLLDLLGVPYARLDAPADVARIPEFYRLGHQRRGPTALLIGAETSA